MDSGALVSLATNTAELVARSAKLADRIPYVRAGRADSVMTFVAGTPEASTIRSVAHEATAAELQINRMWDSAGHVKHGVESLRQAQRGVEKLRRHIGAAVDLGIDPGSARVVTVNMTQAGGAAGDLLRGAQNLARLTNAQHGGRIADLVEQLASSAATLRATPH